MRELAVLVLALALQVFTWATSRKAPPPPAPAERVIDGIREDNPIQVAAGFALSKQRARELLDKWAQRRRVGGAK